MKVRRVEARVLERQRLGAPLAELDPLAEAGRLDAARACGEHLGALVDADDAAAVAAGELDRDTAAVPQATSRTMSSGRASIRETRNERQRGSWPKLRRRA